MPCFKILHQTDKYTLTPVDQAYGTLQLSQELKQPPRPTSTHRPSEIYDTTPPTIAGTKILTTSLYDTDIDSRQLNGENSYAPKKQAPSTSSAKNDLSKIEQKIETAKQQPIRKPRAKKTVPSFTKDKNRHTNNTEAATGETSSMKSEEIVTVRTQSSPKRNAPKSPKAPAPKSLVSKSPVPKSPAPKSPDRQTTKVQIETKTEEAETIYNDIETTSNTNSNTTPNGAPPTPVKRPGVDAGKENLEKVEIDTYEKDEPAKEMIKKAILKNDFLNNMMDAERLEMIVNSMLPGEAQSNSFIIKEGDTGSHLYVSAEGSFEVIKDNKWVSTFGPGVVFGELAILYKAKRFASIRATTNVKFWMLERKIFQKIMVERGRKDRDDNILFLKSVSIFKQLPEETINKISDLLRREFYATGTVIIQQGDLGEKFYIIRGGTVTVTKKDKNGREQKLGTLKRGDYFGEKAIITEERRLASIISNDPGTECLALDREAFLRYIGRLSTIDLHPPKTPTVNLEMFPTTQITSEWSHVRLDDLEIIGPLGVGGFGRVELVQYNNAKTFALKYLKKSEMVQQQQQEHVYNERNIMIQCQSKFIIDLYATYKDNKYLYFLMEPCLGGDIWGLLQKNKCFDERISKFFTACVIAAIEHLHTQNIIYRDLKPENLMLDHRGYVKLIDFGFAKVLASGQKTWTFAGTPEYVAPEIILNRGHDRSVDYWALGIFIHELLVGQPPFRGKDHLKTYTLILRGIDIVSMPPKIPRKAQFLIKSLCRQTPTERLGYQREGIDGIKNHTWFKRFDWKKLESQEMPAPLIRPVKNETDLSNFDECPKDLDEPPDELSGWDSNF